MAVLEEPSLYNGKGLMVGIELVKDSIKTPAVEETKTVHKSCLEKGLLVGVGGGLGKRLENTASSCYY